MKSPGTITLAPALYLAFGISFPEYMISTELYTSQRQAEYELGPTLIKWLIDTPYAITVEVSQDTIDHVLNNAFTRLKEEDDGIS